MSAFASADIPPEEILRWGWMAMAADNPLWDHDGWRVTVRQVQLARDAGALDQLPVLLNRIAADDVWGGDFAAAASLIAEADTVFEGNRSRIAPFPALLPASVRG